MVDRYFNDATLAELYDAFSPPAEREDFAFYRPLVMSARAVLDVGCGTGAMLREAREAGHEGRLCGLDPGSGMIEQARKVPDIEWVLGDLGSVAWAREFDLVVMTGHAFQVLVTDEQLGASLAAIRSALAADGCFAFETRNPASQDWDRWTSRRPAEVTDAAGRTIQMARRVEAPFDGKTLSFSHTFTSPDWAHRQVSYSTLRFLPAEHLASFLSEAGMTIEAQFGDWDRSPLTERSPEIITLARPA